MKATGPSSNGPSRCSDLPDDGDLEPASGEAKSGPTRSQSSPAAWQIFTIEPKQAQPSPEAVIRRRCPQRPGKLRPIEKPNRHNTQQQNPRTIEIPDRQSPGRPEDVIENRALRGIPRDTHGDLRLDHVYWFPDRLPPDDWIVVDCVEFNDRFRHADPIAELAFLAMELSLERHATWPTHLSRLIFARETTTRADCFCRFIAPIARPFGPRSKG